MNKQDLQMYYNELLAELNVKEESYKSGAIAWGFGGYFGVYPKDETVFSNWIEDDDKPTKMMSSKDFLSQFPFYEANSDTLAVKNNNPGNITFANQAGASKSGMFANFDNPMQGWKALYTQVEQDIGRDDTIETFIKGHVEKDYTDAYSKTDQDAYIKFLMQKLKVPKNTLLSKVNKQELVEAIAIQEGYLNPKTGEAPTLEIVNRSLEGKKTKYELIEHEEKIKEDIEYKRGAVSEEVDYEGESYDPSMRPPVFNPSPKFKEDIAPWDVLDTSTKKKWNNNEILYMRTMKGRVQTEAPKEGFNQFIASVDNLDDVLLKRDYDARAGSKNFIFNISKQENIENETIQFIQKHFSKPRQQQLLRLIEQYKKSTGESKKNNKLKLDKYWHKYYTAVN
jgi:hypothetical protein